MNKKSSGLSLSGVCLAGDYPKKLPLDSGLVALSTDAVCPVVDASCLMVCSLCC